MSVPSELDDTAKLFSDLELACSQTQAAIDDTDRLWIRSFESNPAPTNGNVHEYAEGIIRFYRARSILDAARAGDGARRAWRYLEPLCPHDLPTSTRWHFLHLVYFMQQTDTQEHDEDEFADRVRTIGALIDQYVDRLNFELDRSN
jgi:hypothetical protein